MMEGVGRGKNERKTHLFDLGLVDAIDGGRHQGHGAEIDLRAEKELQGGDP